MKTPLQGSMPCHWKGLVYLTFAMSRAVQGHPDGRVRAESSDTKALKCDREAWRDVLHGVAKSQTRLGD